MCLLHLVHLLATSGDVRSVDIDLPYDSTNSSLNNSVLLNTVSYIQDQNDQMLVILKELSVKIEDKTNPLSAPEQVTIFYWKDLVLLDRLSM